jgi:hypothetical protein
MILLSSIVDNKFIVMKKWIHPNTIVGPAADGEKYFRRKKIEEQLWREIAKGSHILFSAPRRVGKSSVMKFIAKNSPEEYSCSYKNISSDSTANKFYKRLFDLAIIQLDRIEKAKELLSSWKEKVGINKIGADGVSFSEKEVDYKSRLLELLPKLKQTDIKIVLFLDEFPYVINNIIKNENKLIAKDVLQTLRGLRENEDFKGNFTLVLAGSIGLNHVVKKIDRTTVINDLNKQSLSALSPNNEATEFIKHLTKGATMQISDKCSTYILERLKEHIPYYIQLIIEECDNILYDKEEINLTEAHIDTAWENLLNAQDHFVDWSDRLKEFFPKDYPFFMTVLQSCAHQSTLSIQELYNIGDEHNLQLDYKAKIDDVLIKDGYLYQEGNSFRFVSPLLQDWWKKRYPFIDKKK